MRNLELDNFRALAIIFMIIYHILYDISYFFPNSLINLKNIYLIIFQKIIIFMFLFAVGISITLYKSKEFKVFLYKSSKIGIFALIITIISLIFDKNTFIFFGILHLIFLSILLGYFFKSLKLVNLFLSIFIILFGIIFSTQNIFLSFLIINNNLVSIDYVPLFPYFAFTLIGISFANYHNKYLKKRKIFLKENKITKFLELIGRNSLTIYLIHQPILFLFLYILKVLI